MPVASFADARRQIAAGRPAPVYLIVGDDPAETDAFLDALEALVEASVRPLNVRRFYATDREATPAAVVDAARTMPMMAARRVVVVRRAERWLKPRRAGEEEPAADPSGVEALAEYLERPAPFATLVLVASDVHRGLSIVKALYRSAVVLECVGAPVEAAAAHGAARALIARVRETIAGAGRRIDDDAATLLAERAGFDPVRLRGDVERVLLYTTGRDRVTRADIEAVVRERGGAMDDWALVRAIEKGDAAAALRELARVVEEGKPKEMLLGQLAWFVREHLAQARPAAVPAALDLLLRTDLGLKRSAGDPRVLLERLVSELAGLALAAAGSVRRSRFIRRDL